MIYELKKVHEDLRRALYEFGAGGTWKVCKYIEVKQDSVIGDHFHLAKNELFLLSKGTALVTLGKLKLKVTAPVIIEVKKRTYHKFQVKKGAIIIGLASEEHSDKDDYKSVDDIKPPVEAEYHQGAAFFEYEYKKALAEFEEIVNQLK